MARRALWFGQDLAVRLPLERALQSRGYSVAVVDSAQAMPPVPEPGALQVVLIDLDAAGAERAAVLELGQRRQAQGGCVGLLAANWSRPERLRAERSGMRPFLKPVFPGHLDAWLHDVENALGSPPG
jgi:CheY-like chemotaxis protein